MPDQRRVSVDLSLYPLTDAYLPPIRALIRRLQASEGVAVETNAMSTQVHGPFARVWELLGELLPECFGANFLQVVVIKLVSVDVTE